MYIKQLWHNNRGDTLVEVLLATVVLSLVLGSSFTLANRSLRLNQTATERTEVVNKMREQTEMLRFISENRDTAPIDQAWADIETIAGIPTISDRDFYFELFNTPGDSSSGFVDLSNATNAGNFVQTYTGVNDSYTDDFFTIKIRIVDVQNNPANAAPASINPEGYLDFAIDASWDGIGGLGQQSASSVLRLPR